MTTMIAKFKVVEVVHHPLTETTSPAFDEIKMMAVTDAPFNAEGDSDDNTFARWTPSGEIKMTITNPSLIGQLHEGEKYYLNFTKA